MDASLERSQPRAKAARTTLEVRIGKLVLRQPVAASVFCEALQAMDLNRVASVGLTASGLPLISKSGPPVRHGGQRGYREVDDWFIVTHTSTREKKAILEQAADALNIPIEVKILSLNDLARAQLLE